MTRLAASLVLLVVSGCPWFSRPRPEGPATQPAVAPPREVARGIARWDGAEAPLPALTEDEEAYLLRLARQTLVEHLERGTLSQLTESWPGLAAKPGRLFLALLCRGERWASARTGEGDLTELVRLATIEAAGGPEFAAHLRARATARQPLPFPANADWSFVLDVAGPRQAVPARTIEELDPLIVPGIHGLGVRARREEAEVCAADAVAHRAAAPEMLRRIEALARLAPGALAENGRGLHFYRFRSLTFGDGPTPGEVVAYRRGVRLVGQEEIGSRALGDALKAGVDYLTRHQGEDGRLPRAYEAWRDREIVEVAPYEQALAIRGLTRAAYAPGAGKMGSDPDEKTSKGQTPFSPTPVPQKMGSDPDEKTSRTSQSAGQTPFSTTPARRAIEALLGATANANEAAPVIQAENGRHLGATALVLDVLTDLAADRDAGGLADWRPKLVQTLTANIGRDDRYAGPFAQASTVEAAQAIVALARLARQAEQKDARRSQTNPSPFQGEGGVRVVEVPGKPSSRPLTLPSPRGGEGEAAERLWRGYAEALAARGDPETVGWALLAAAALEEVAPKEEYAQAALAAADWLSAYQYRPGALSVPYDDCLGGWKGSHGVPYGAETALFVEGLAGADRLARGTPAAGRYRAPLAYGVRYLLQLQYRPEDGWMAQRPAACLGGFRASLADHTLTSGQAGLALAALAAVLHALPAQDIDEFAHPPAPTTSRPTTTRAASAPAEADHGTHDERALPFGSRLNDSAFRED